MKRIFIGILVIICVFCFSCCSSDRTILTPVNFYYCANDISYNAINGVVVPQVQEVDLQNEDLITVLNRYLKAPTAGAFHNPFPVGTAITHLDRDDTTLYITVSPEFGKVSGLELTLACACLCKTALELTDLQAVQIQCADTLLDGNPVITMGADSFVWLDTAETTPKTAP